MFSSKAPLMFQPSSVRKSNANKLMIENARYLTPDQEKGLEDFPVKQKALMEHMVGEAQAQAAGRHIEWLQERDRQIEDMAKAADKYGTHGRIVIMKQIQKDMERKSEDMIEDQALRERYGDQYHAMQMASQKFSQATMEGMERRYMMDVKNGKTNSDSQAITMRIGPGGVEVLHNIKNVQELEEYGPEALADVDLDELMPDAEQFEADEVAQAGGEGWIPQYAKKRLTSESDADKWLEDEFLNELSKPDIDEQWKRTRLQKVRKHHPQLKDKTQVEMDSIPVEDLNKYLAHADARRIRDIDDKRIWKERQSIVRDARRKEQDARAKGLKTRSIVSDATAEQVAKFNLKQGNEWVGTAGKIGAGALAGLGGALGLYKLFGTARSDIAATNSKNAAEVILNQAKGTMAQVAVGEAVKKAAGIDWAKYFALAQQYRIGKRIKDFLWGGALGGVNGLTFGIPGVIGGIVTGGMANVVGQWDSDEANFAPRNAASPSVSPSPSPSVTSEIIA
jgi:hypothetical protein